MTYTPPPLNDKPIEHVTSGGVTFRCARADLRVVITVHDLSDNFTSLEKVAEAIADFTAWHALNIFGQLNGFQGYGALRFRFEEE